MSENKKITWDEAKEVSEEEFIAFLKAKKSTGLPKGYHKPEIFD